MKDTAPKWERRAGLPGRAWDYDALRELVRGEGLPLGVVDLDCLERNIQRVARIASASQKTIRIATKSVRCPELTRHILDFGGKAFKGLMCYSAPEAAFLARQGFDDLLIAYPSVQNEEFEMVFELTLAGKQVILMIDEAMHVELLTKFFKVKEVPADFSFSVCLDVDLSLRPFSGALHLGVQRSPIRSLEDFNRMVRLILNTKHLTLSGIMGYEAQIAGVPDGNPFTPLLNPIVAWVKSQSKKAVARRREAISRYLDAQSVRLEIFNGGGSGSIKSTVREPWLTEVTVGSGFLQSHIYDYFGENECEPAFCFALPVTRIPEPGMVTCQSGGFVASGAASWDKSPIPFLPEGLRALPSEGFGEVQTPLRNRSQKKLLPGDPVFFRPAKAGEIAERFNEYLLRRGNEIEARVKTYRGLGQCFY